MLVRLSSISPPTAEVDSSSNRKDLLACSRDIKRTFSRGFRCESAITPLTSAPWRSIGTYSVAGFIASDNAKRRQLHSQAPEFFHYISRPTERRFASQRRSKWELGPLRDSLDVTPKDSSSIKSPMTAIRQRLILQIVQRSCIIHSHSGGCCNQTSPRSCYKMRSHDSGENVND